MIKKVFSFLLVLIIISTFLLPSADALSYNDSQSVCDLLSAGSYKMTGYSNSDGIIHDVHFSNVITYSPFFNELSVPVGGGEHEIVNYDDVGLISIYWEPLVQTACSNFYMYFYRKSGSISVKVNGKTAAANFTGYSGGYYAYNVTFTNDLINSIEVTYQTLDGNNFTSPCGVLSCFTFPTQSRSINTGDIAVDKIFSEYSSGGWVYSYERYLTGELDLESDKDYPYYSPVVSIENYWTNEDRTNLQVRVHLTFDLYANALSDAVDSFRLSYATIGECVGYSAYLSDSNNEWQNDGLALTSTQLYADFAKHGINNPYVEYEANGYNLFVDLSGCNIRDNRYIHIELVIDSLNAGRDYDTYTYFELFAVEYYFTVFSDLTQSNIISNLEKILNSLNYSKDTLEDFYDSYVDSSSDILNYLSLIESALTASLEQQEAMDQNNSSLSSQSGQLGSLNSDLSSVSKEQINVGSLISGFTSYNNNSMNTLAVVANNKYVYIILLAVFTFAVLGYILFGKR